MSTVCDLLDDSQITTLLSRLDRDAPDLAQTVRSNGSLIVELTVDLADGWEKTMRLVGLNEMADDLRAYTDSVLCSPSLAVVRAAHDEMKHRSEVLQRA